MRLPRVSVFTLIGVVLLIIGVIGLVRGAAFQFEPGVPPEHAEGWYYLLVGALMVLNGFFHSPSPQESEPGSEGGAAKDDTPKKPIAPAVVAMPTQPSQQAPPQA